MNKKSGTFSKTHFNHTAVHDTLYLYLHSLTNNGCQCVDYVGFVRPNENPHTTQKPFTNPVAINNPFHDKITFNYFSLLLCNLSSDNDSISQIL